MNQLQTELPDSSPPAKNQGEEGEEEEEEKRPSEGRRAKRERRQSSGGGGGGSSATVCLVCSIQLNSSAQAQIHYRGKTHQRRLRRLAKAVNAGRSRLTDTETKGVAGSALASSTVACQVYKGLHQYSYKVQSLTKPEKNKSMKLVSCDQEGRVLICRLAPCGQLGHVPPASMFVYKMTNQYILSCVDFNYKDLT